MYLALEVSVSHLHTPKSRHATLEINQHHPVYAYRAITLFGRLFQTTSACQDDVLMVNSKHHIRLRKT